MRGIICFCCVMLCAVIGLAAEQAGAKVAQPYVFTDDTAVITVPTAGADITYTVKTITAAGWGPVATVNAAVVDHTVKVTPLCEGIHIVTFPTTPPQEVRFLALLPPPAIDKRRIAANLPLSSRKLLRGEKYTLLSMGDSVTNTGDYESMLVMLLQRATGNKNITFIDRSYPGRSVDASVRFFPEDALTIHPDLGIIMYGLNDQAAGCSVEGYLDQYHWLRTQLAADCHADSVFMTPTPDISVGDKPGPYGEYIMRTFGFAARLTTFAKANKIPLADTFHAVWGKGGETLDATGISLWPKYPQGYSAQFTSMLETKGNGDGIHINALGHLNVAQAAFRAITGIALAPMPLSFTATSNWTDNGVMSNVTVKNISRETRTGKLTLYPIPDGAVATTYDGQYTLKPGAKKTFQVSWPQLKTPEDLLKYPNNQYITPYQPLFSVFDAAAESGVLYYLEAPFVVADNFTRERLRVASQTATVTLKQGKRRTPVTVTIPDGAEVGRIPLVQKIENRGKTGYATAEIAYTRYGAARTGEATVDGDLQEWDAHHWSPVGDPVQARWTQGIIDGRTTPQECQLNWAFKAGQKGVFFAAKGTGQLTKDRFTLFFDNRAPELLGTPGRYYWASGSIGAAGKIELGKGETSAVATGMTGAWRTTPEGIALELFIPYDLLEATTWPARGDLGLSIWWVHTNTKDAKGTNIFWSEDGQPWSTRWYGVVTLDDTGTKPLPYMVRVK